MYSLTGHLVTQPLHNYQKSFVICSDRLIKSIRMFINAQNGSHSGSWEWNYSDHWAKYVNCTQGSCQGFYQCCNEIVWTFHIICMRNMTLCRIYISKFRKIYCVHMHIWLVDIIAGNDIHREIASSLSCLQDGTIVQLTKEMLQEIFHLGKDSTLVCLSLCIY